MNGRGHDPSQEGEERQGRRLPSLAALSERFGLLIAWALVTAIFGVLEPRTFLTQANFSTILGSQAVLVVLALGLLPPLTAGDYDLSIAAMLTLSAVTIAHLNVHLHWPIAIAIGVALITGAVVGMVNGLIMTVFEVDSLITTLGTGTVLSGVVLWITHSNTISGVSNTWVNLVVGARPLGVPLEFYYGLALAFLLWYVLEFTALGRRLLVVGRGRTVARLSGYHVPRLRVGAMVSSGIIGAGAGALYVGTLGGADPTSGLTFLLPAFAAAFLGATSIVPGRFNPWGTMVAVYFLVTGITGLVILGMESFVQDLFYGGALVIAVVLSQVARRRAQASS
ncbi:MAG TPA: ABC transporter permease [Candidatus Dormibacteraeota bacterium]|nr:ABC transporter permease [Candidatus Dormibacteraeota bacterium]